MFVCGKVKRNKEWAGDGVTLIIWTPYKASPKSAAPAEQGKGFGFDASLWAIGREAAGAGGAGGFGGFGAGGGAYRPFSARVQLGLESVTWTWNCSGVEHKPRRSPVAHRRCGKLAFLSNPGGKDR